jgi:transposase
MDIHAQAVSERTTTTTTTTEATLATRVAELEAQLVSLTKERDRLRASHDRLREELELLKRRLFIAKAERVDTAQLEMEFAAKMREFDALAGTTTDDDGDEDDDGDDNEKKKRTPTGRRDLRNLPMPEERIEIPDALYEQLVAEGKAERIGFVESFKIGFKRGGKFRVVVARVKYQVTTPSGETSLDVAPLPPELFPRALCAPSLLAHIVMLKYGDGMPLFRIEERFRRDGVPIDRGTMCRWLEDAGATCGATVVHAARQDAQSAFCIATDATGVSVQPIRTHEKSRQACKRGHYFVHIADREHVFFEYVAKETSAAVSAMFKGYSGYVQADAKSVFDVLFRDPRERPPDDDDECVRIEVACWSHARRKFWEAAIAKNAVAREALVRIGRIFDLDAAWRKNPPAEIKRRRDVHMRPHMESFFAWADVEYERVREQRGSLRSALGYALRQKDALMRVLDDGRLLLDNNRSERELRKIAVGRKAWLFVGSDDHAESAGHLFSLVASCKLHALDPEAYFRDLFRVLPHWPKDRYLELAPKFWAATRARLHPDQLARELGPLDVPPPLDATTEEQTATNRSD